MGELNKEEEKESDRMRNMQVDMNRLQYMGLKQL